MKKLVIISLMILLSACKAGDGEGLNDQGRSIEETVENTEDTGDVVDDGIQPTLKSIQENIFTPICSSCHGGANPAAGQNLSSIEDSISNLINVGSSNPLFKRVLPGSALESYLYLKVTGDSKAGTQMPLGQPALSEDAIDAIKLWIDKGALVSENSNTPARINRVSNVYSMKKTDSNNTDSAQLDYKWEEEGSLVVVFWFNQAMNFEGLTSEQILVTVNNDYRTDDSEGWLLSSENISMNIINDHTLQLNIANLESDISHINIQLNNSAVSTLVTHSGQELDGDIDGTDGGIFNYELSL